LPGDTRCLVRSVVLVGLLARRSVATTLVIGVLPGDRLRAHAWVELDGQALLDDGGSRYERLTEL
jgi:Transglutaminase-like superfamily